MKQRYRADWQWCTYRIAPVGHQSYQRSSRFNTLIVSSLERQLNPRPRGTESNCTYFSRGFATGTYSVYGMASVEVQCELTKQEGYGWTSLKVPKTTNCITICAFLMQLWRIYGVPVANSFNSPGPAATRTGSRLVALVRPRSLPSHAIYLSARGRHEHERSCCRRSFSPVSVAVGTLPTAQSQN